MKKLILFLFIIPFALEAFFNEEQQEETADELLTIMGSITGIGILSLISTSLATHLLFNVPMYISVPFWLLILPLIYHFYRVFRIQKKALL